MHPARAGIHRALCLGLCLLGYGADGRLQMREVPFLQIPCGLCAFDAAGRGGARIRSDLYGPRCGGPAES